MPEGADGAEEEKLPSVGSAGHPDKCAAPCKYHWKAKGCKDGAACSRCHMCPWKRQKAAGKKQAESDESSSEEVEKKAGEPKTQQQIERDERLEANYKKYEPKSDEELRDILPKRENGTDGSIGSMLHASGLCSPCGFIRAAKGCSNALRCKYCHADHAKKRKARGRKRKADRAGSSDREEAPPRRYRENERPREVRLDARGNSRPSWFRDDYGDIYGRMLPPLGGGVLPPGLPPPGAYGVPPPHYGHPPHGAYAGYPPPAHGAPPPPHAEHAPPGALPPPPHHGGHPSTAPHIASGYHQPPPAYHHSGFPGYGHGAPPPQHTAYPLPPPRA
eukprot:TRINITY_DN92720_c0_g1_i1.p1 TRINITY_DN92720_c0_g1~~TRINITY_DN92720_c0_g1_i1.p1  ORF type:complete len:332 (-),score=58.31 TRINITY_DN92720_c0_g1_i1:34-1029(-)